MHCRPCRLRHWVHLRHCDGPVPRPQHACHPHCLPVRHPSAPWLRCRPPHLICTLRWIVLIAACGCATPCPPHCSAPSIQHDPASLSSTGVMTTVTPPTSSPSAGWAKYIVSACIGTTCNQIDCTPVNPWPTITSCPLSNLFPGTTYTISVRARPRWRAVPPALLLGALLLFQFSSKIMCCACLAAGEGSECSKHPVHAECH